MKLKKYIFGAVLLAACVLGCACAQSGEGTKNPEDTTPTMAATDTPNETPTPEVTPTPIIDYPKIKVVESKTYQTWDNFGVSGCWWSQYVGGWDQPYKGKELATREEIARLLYSKEEGIGLTSYRYNLGGGSVEAKNGNFWYPERRAESFETAPGVYDFTKDANAQWFLKRVVELTEGNVDVILFANSPLSRLTINGIAHGDPGFKTNINVDKYDDFAKYLLDVAEYFVSQGIPVTEISPINEPQWEWAGGQEGCYYTPAQCAALLRVCVEEIQKREALNGVVISAPEGGSWGTDTQQYVKAILDDDYLGDYFTAIDCHSYWTDTNTKVQFRKWMNQNYPDVALRMSEWCEMVNGSDYTMDSALNMAACIIEDITKLQVEAWQYWVGVANGGYRDGLIYVNVNAQAFRPAKRLWAMGNFSKFIRPGYVRVDCTNNDKQITGLRTTAFTGVNDEGQEELVIVVLNRNEGTTVQLNLEDYGKYNYYEVYTTDETHDLEMTAGGEYTDQYVPVTIGASSVVTIRLVNKK